MGAYLPNYLCLQSLIVLWLQVLHLSNLFFLVFNLACAFAPNTASLIIFRFLGKSTQSV